jgi:outer membrane protein assembly factor BamB
MCGMRWLAIVLVMTQIAAGRDWPQWRGPFTNGTSDGHDWAVRWSETQNVRWRTPLPSWSGATPIVSDDRVYVTSPSAAGQGPKAPLGKGSGDRLRPEGRDLLLLCISRKDGAIRWTVKLDDGNAHSGKQNMSSPSPVTDGKRVWAMTGSGVLTGLDRDGSILWQRHIQKEYGTFGQMWGYASSPALVDGKLIVQVLHGDRTDDPSYILAVDPTTGKNLWKVDRPTDAEDESPDAYSTPVPMRDGQRMLIVIGGGDYLTANDVASGEEVWRCGGLNPTRSKHWRGVSSPLVVGDMIFHSIREGPLVACRAGGKGLVTSTHLAWTSEIAPDVPCPVSDGRYLYVLQDRGFLSCLELASGKPLYAKQRLPRGTYSASPLLADGRIYVTSEEARTTVLATGPQFKIIAENQLDDGYTLSSIAAAGRELFIRTSRALYCIAAPEAASQPAR